MYAIRSYYETRYERLDVLFSKKIPCVIVTKELDDFPEMIEVAKKNNIPLLKSEESTSNCLAALIAFLNLRLAPRITRHGVLIEIYGRITSYNVCYTKLLRTSIIVSASFGK